MTHLVSKRGGLIGPMCSGNSKEEMVWKNLTKGSVFFLFVFLGARPSDAQRFSVAIGVNLCACHLVVLVNPEYLSWSSNLVCHEPASVLGTN